MIISKQNIISTIAILLGMAIIVSCENDSEDIKNMNAINKLPLIEMWDFERINTSKGKEKFKLSAPFMQYFERDSSVYIFPKGFHLEMYSYIDGKKVIKSEISADSARYLNKFRLDAFNNVLIKNIKQDKLETNFLSWDEKKEYISTNDSVEITRNGQKFYGIGLEGKQDFSTYTIHKTTGIIHTNAE